VYWVKTGKILPGVAGLIILTAATPGLAVQVALDTADARNGLTDLFSATFDGALAPCTGGSPTYCPFFAGEPGPTRQISITPNPTQVINGVPLGISPTPIAGSFLEMTLAPDKSTVTLAGGVIALPVINLNIQGTTSFQATGAGIVFGPPGLAQPGAFTPAGGGSTGATVALNASGQAEFLVNLAPLVTADFSTLSTVAGNCAGPLCSIVPILTLDMVRYRLLIDYDPFFSSFTTSYIGQTANNSLVFATLNTQSPVGFARPDNSVTFLQTPVAIPVLANDGSLANPSTVSLFSLPIHGSAVINGSPGSSSNISISYTPAPGFTGIDTFEYRVEAGTYSGVARVTITVAPPDAVDDFVSTDGQIPLNIPVLANDVGFTDPVTVGISIDPTHGTTQVTGSPGLRSGIRITYTPAVNFAGIDTFDYFVDDFVRADSGTVTVTVLPSALPDNAVTPLNTPVMIPVGANDVGFTNPATVVVLSAPSHGSASVNGSPGDPATITITYLPGASYGGLDSFTYRISNGATQSTATVTIRVNPDAVDDQAVVIADIPKTLAILANDIGFTDPVTVAITSAPAHGSVALQGSPGSQSGIQVTYTRSPGFQGMDSFTYSVSDGFSTDTATAMFRVTDDTDADGVLDYQDNCTLIANANQRDTNSDGYGNLCDPDFNNNGIVDSQDGALLKAAFGSAAFPDRDLNGNGIVDSNDGARLKAKFGQPPGLSGLACAGSIPCPVP